MEGNLVIKIFSCPTNSVRRRQLVFPPNARVAGTKDGGEGWVLLEVSIFEVVFYVFPPRRACILIRIKTDPNTDIPPPRALYAYNFQM